ncbi:hypothetical protein HF086_012180 [Spodoptera exigua]|uniref:Serine/threonine-protein phosphatase PGAM5, mitochondrial n=1 Tax=Spodoptera exigua TaxID=7107 RepID=A0A922M6R3_SPOEX|nr:hypothetical protein HF086_012180 [Spodoptera exigua]
MGPMRNSMGPMRNSTGPMGNSTGPMVVVWNATGEYSNPPFWHVQQFFQDSARIEAGFRRYFYRAPPEQTEDSYTLLVCHANVIRYFVCKALQFPPEGWLRISLNHASITWISIMPNGNVVLRSLSDTGHMEPKYITSR